MVRLIRPNSGEGEFDVFLVSTVQEPKLTIIDAGKLLFNRRPLQGLYRSQINSDWRFVWATPISPPGFGDVWGFGRRHWRWLRKTIFGPLVQIARINYRSISYAALKCPKGAMNCSSII